MTQIKKFRILIFEFRIGFELILKGCFTRNSDLGF
jgi:hypothetical protein